jgi:hypothetical protein
MLSSHAPAAVEGKRDIPAPILPENPEQGNLYYTVGFLLLVAAMNCVQDTIATKSKALRANASAQNSIVDSLKQIRFAVITKPDPGALTIQKISEQNKMIAGYQQVLQEELVNLRQGGQILMTGATTQVDAMEQGANANSTLLSTIHQSLTLIMQIGPTKAKQ